MQNRMQIESEIERMETKLSETLASAQYNSGPLRDNLRVIVPMMQDQIRLMRMILDFVQDDPQPVHGG